MALVAVWFQECGIPVLVSLEVPAKSFVLRRCSNFYFSRPHKLFRRPVFAGCRRGFRLKPCPDTKHDVPRLIRGAESQIIGVLVRTVLQLGFIVQRSGKKRCGRRVGELRGKTFCALSHRASSWNCLSATRATASYKLAVSLYSRATGSTILSFPCPGFAR